MVDRISKEKRSKIMSAIRSKNTQPELSLRRFLWSKGLRYRVHYGEEKIDIAFPSKKIAIFVDGCFWHGCPIHSHIPKSNKAYWVPKLQKNKKRDATVNQRLEKKGWKIVRIWEHDLTDIEEIFTKIQKCLDNPKS